jgi:hypothetical protein
VVKPRKTQHLKKELMPAQEKGIPMLQDDLSLADFALIECLRVFARRGLSVRKEQEQNKEQPVIKQIIETDAQNQADEESRQGK